MVFQHNDKFGTISEFNIRSLSISPSDTATPACWFDIHRQIYFFAEEGIIASLITSIRP